MAITAGAALAELSCQEAEVAYLEHRAAIAERYKDVSEIGTVLMPKYVPYEDLGPGDAVAKWQFVTRVLAMYKLGAAIVLDEMSYPPGVAPFSDEFRADMKHEYPLLDRLEACYRRAAVSGTGSVAEEVAAFDADYPEDTRARHRRALEALQ